ncbi:hypothetical protein GALMADRAFT_148002 [Galerina marginata CBS 339.88]|uniref:tRNA (uracil-O(2)-)-methyltransferase n=1 Tax=Galerina marginata (strain CBS 339.88) TaxID=685588 RepID=A0A067SHI7_GALM3|nr:hypothetical protein GALMADRAFT_148002 [Galerina marginata CBS 339.88]
MDSARPKFEPRQYDSSNKTLHEGWIPLVSCAANFPIEIFEIAITQLIHHPEYNSTLILRSEVLEDTTTDFPDFVPKLENLQRNRRIRRRLLPRRPGRDQALDQDCTLYGPETSENALSDTLVLTPIVEPGSSLPYYHPMVAHLAFRYISSTTPMLIIEVEPLPGTPLDPNARLYRTCLALLETLHRYGWGAMTNYRKRVLHDCLIPREEYQDLYLVMRERHKHLVDTWQEVTDPLKHVFEDIGIATYLMMLWKDTFRSDTFVNALDSTEPWKAWPRPPGGFLDLGCGNGLLSHILVSEGYEGYGIDLRARTSWTHYPDSSQSRLRVHAFDPTADHDDYGRQTYFKPGVFVIGNHADELTPWLPVLSTLHDSSGYISIPCCSWAFDKKYERSSTPAYPIPDGFVESLNLGGEGSNKSSYSMYRIWLASLSLHCGWEVECETLRIPSTRNWAIIGRQRFQLSSDDQALSNVNEILEGVKVRGMFKTRKPEGKAADH